MRKSGFTLIEMIAVLLILAILSAATTAGLSSAREKAWRTQAREICRNVCVAWNAYLLDARRFPKAIPGKGQKLEATYSNMMWIVDASKNEFQRIYLEISDDEKTDGLRDHWIDPKASDPKAEKGQLILFSLDTDYDNQVDNPYPNASDPPLPKAKATSLAWSKGNPRRAKRNDNPIVVW